MSERTRLRTRTNRRRGREPTKNAFHQFVESLPRPYPDPFIEWHIGLYDMVTMLKRRLERLTYKPLLSNEDLLELGVVRGAELIIDEDHPIDLEPRFFQPGSSHVVARSVQIYYETEQWPELRKEPIPRGYRDYSLVNDWDIGVIEAISYSCWTLTDWERRYSYHWQHYTYQKNPNWFGPTITPKTDFIVWKQDYIGQGHPHRFLLRKWLASRRSSGQDDLNPEVPHTLAMVLDTILPDNRILRSELLMAAMLLGETLAQQFWPGHYTLPVLMFSFSSTGCRLLQIHFENGRLHIRASRPLDLISRDRTVPPDAQLVARWLMADPIGRTRFSESLHINFGEDDQRDPQNPGPSCVPALSP